MPVTPRQLQRFKSEQRPIVALTAWDYLSASLLDAAGVDVVLVGDSLAMVALGHRTTLPLTLDQAIHHTQAVQRGVREALIVVDLPFLTYQPSPEEALRAAGRILKETEAQAVKLEGGSAVTVETVARLTDAGIPVMAHLGLTPQSVHQLGYTPQARDPLAQQQLITQAAALEAAGAFALVLEHIPAELAVQVTQRLSIPTIGIGAGSGCDGQVLVTADLLGLTEQQPPFVTPYAQLRELAIAALRRYIADVRQG